MAKLSKTVVARAVLLLSPSSIIARVSGRPSPVVPLYVHRRIRGTIADPNRVPPSNATAKMPVIVLVSGDLGALRTRSLPTLWALLLEKLLAPALCWVTVLLNFPNNAPYGKPTLRVYVSISV